MLLVLVGTGAGPASFIGTTVTLVPAQTLRGWGMALAWEANVIYGSPRVAPQIPDPAEQDRYMDLLFGDPARGPGLGLNVARYNIGGGDNPDRAHCLRTPHDPMRPAAEMEGFLTGPHEPYDWSRDASQRRMLHEAQRRGADVFEAFSNSAPWWMTASRCVAGAVHGEADNLRPDAVPAFARYLAAVVAHFRRREGIRFASVSPLNEPDGIWWSVGNRQEGSHASLPRQEAVLVALHRALAGTGVVVSGTEANDLDHMTAYLAHMQPASLAALGRVNVHQYNGHDPAALHRRVAALGKPLWASEVGCCFSPHPPMWAGLYMAESIRSALHDLGAQAWCFWQPDWEVIDASGGHPFPLKQFYAIAQFTRFIRPGFTVLAITGSADMVAAVSPDRRRLVLVAINRDDREQVRDFDLGALHRAGSAVALYRTTADASTNLARRASRLDATGHLIDRQPPGSVTTYVSDGPPISGMLPNESVYRRSGRRSLMIEH